MTTTTNPHTDINVGNKEQIDELREKIGKCLNIFPDEFEEYLLNNVGTSHINRLVDLFTHQLELKEQEIYNAGYTVGCADGLFTRAKDLELVKIEAKIEELNYIIKDNYYDEEDAYEYVKKYLIEELERRLSELTKQKDLLTKENK